MAEIVGVLGLLFALSGIAIALHYEAAVLVLIRLLLVCCVLTVGYLAWRLW